MNTPPISQISQVDAPHVDDSSLKNRQSISGFSLLGDAGERCYYCYSKSDYKCFQCGKGICKEHAIIILSCPSLGCSKIEKGLCKSNVYCQVLFE
jgi:hypothetical protein